MSSRNLDLSKQTGVDHRYSNPENTSCDFTFPFRIFNYYEAPKQQFYDPLRTWLLRHFQVHAAEDSESVHLVDKGTVHPYSRLRPPLTDATDGGNNSSQPSMHTWELEMLARAYIQRETGMERVRMIFKKDHMGRSSPEMEYIQVALVQVFVLTFFMKYVPEWRLAKQDFIREHHGTVFRTRLEAVRRMQDHISLRAGWTGGKFAIKMTAFSASFMFLSQMIASYRNRTSVLEYTVAAGITGGLSRLQLGIKGFIAGSVLGSILGSVIGCLAYGIFRKNNATQEQRHVYGVMEMLEVEKSIEGDSEFKKKVDLVKQNELKGVLSTS